MENIQDFINRIGLTSTNVRMSDSDRFNWKVIIKLGDRSHEFGYFCGGAHIEPKSMRERGHLGLGVTDKDISRVLKSGFYYDFNTKQFLKRGFTSVFDSELANRLFKPKAPDLASVLTCLAVDSDAIESCFEDWAYNLGYNPDSITDKRIYEACVSNYYALKKLLGGELYRLMEIIRNED